MVALSKLTKMLKWKLEEIMIGKINSESCEQIINFKKKTKKKKQKNKKQKKKHSGRVVCANS